MTEDERVSLRDFMEEKFKAVEERFTIVDAALTLARTQLEKRLEGMNEFREALKESQDRNITKDEYGSQHQRLVDKLESECKRLEERIEQSAKGKYPWWVTIVASGFFVLLAILITHFINT